MYSIDSINQVLCMSFGIASVLLYPKFKYFAKIICDAGLVPIIEPEVDINAPEKEK